MHSFEDHIKQAADRYVAGIERGGLQPSEKLVRAIIERAQQDYQKQIVEEHLDNMEAIMKAHNERQTEIKRESAKLRMWGCPPIALLFAGMAVYSYMQHQGATSIIVTVMMGFGSLAFLAMLILGAIFDRPKE